MKKGHNSKTNHISGVIAALLVACSFAGIASVNSEFSYALSYESQAGVGFVVDGSINLSITGDIVIPELFVGTSKESNVVDINVSTNVADGYSLSAKMGSDSQDLAAAGISIKIAGLSTTASESDLSDNTWGYKVKPSAGSWSNYSGLPILSNDEKILVERTTKSTSGSETTQFKIGAHAAATLPTGNYTNTIVFHVVANFIPDLCAGLKSMQDITAADISGMALEEQVQMCDARDGKIYWVAKLKDGKVWMTQNLDLNLDSGTTLTSNDTDLNTSGSGAYVDGYSTSDGVISYTPLRTTINATNNKTTTGTSGTITGWSDDNNTPYSVDVGDVYQTGIYFSSSSCNYLTTACDKFKNTPDTTSTTPNAEHGHVGNYYNWSAAIASNSSNSLTTLYTTAQNSICPKGWHLPIGSDSSSNDDFKTLNTLYNSGSTSTDQGLFNSPLYFSRAGYVNSGSLYDSGYGGHVWSSSVFSSSYAYDLYFRSGYVRPQGSYDRGLGFSVRCVAE